MKKLLLLLSLLFFTHTYAQISFGEQNIIIQGIIDGPYSVYSTDIDGDGDMDVLSATVNGNRIIWYENTNGEGDFSEVKEITTMVNGAVSVYASDIDDDGDQDVLSASSNDNKIAWYENLDGNGSFGSQQVISITAVEARQVYTSDIDGDGDQDVLGASRYGDEIAWYENIDGNGSFSEPQVITTSTYLPSSIYTSDIDGDGDQDVLSASFGDDTINWYENIDGNGTFGTHEITHLAHGAQSVFSCDIDGDGDQDVLSAVSGVYPYYTDSISWYENLDGHGNFSSRKLITYDVDSVRSVFATDVDGDGDKDVLSASLDGKIALYLNIDGNGTFDTQYLISNTEGGAMSIYSADIDGDGNQDVLSASVHENNLTWYNNTSGNGDIWLRKSISTSANGASSVFAADIDGDGNQDVLSASVLDAKIAWYKNIDGNGNFGAQQIIAGNVGGARSVYATDIDGDNDMDVLSASTDNDIIAWYENIDGNGNFGSQQVITSNAESARSVYATDIDGDGDTDVLWAAYLDGIAWHENIDGNGNFSPKKVISTIAWGISVFTADIDGDGDQDVLSASSGNEPYDTRGKITWYENTDGNGNFGGEQLITDDIFIAKAVFASDIDGDGDIDVLSASEYDNKLSWYENTDGNGNFGLHHLISDNSEGFRSVYSVDIDDDGDQDVLSASSYDNEIAWYENTDGNGTFSEQLEITTTADGAQSVYSVDIDGDGDQDVLSASFADDKIAWYENLGVVPISVDQSAISFFSIYPNPTVDFFTVTSQSRIIQIELFNQLGQIIKTIFDTNNIEISEFSQGLYVVKIIDENGHVETRKVVKE